jgi:predicted Zn-dependent peptidase
VRLKRFGDVTINIMPFDFYRLKNGVRVMLVPMEGVKSIGVGVYVQTGSRYETEKINGISHFLEHMAFKGTKKFPTHYDTSYLEGLGAIQNAWTDVDATAYWAKIPADKWREGLEVAKELALYPTIPEKDLEIERGVILEEINRRDDRPDEIVSEELQKLMFSGNNLGMMVLGKPEVIKSVTQKDFLNYHDSQYVSNRIVVVLAGRFNVQDSRIKEQIEEWFGGLPKNDGKPYEVFEDKQNNPEVIIAKKKLAAQAHVELGVRGVNDLDERRFALAVLTSYLGSGLSSRLFTELREKRGLCYSVHASNQSLEDTGIWSVYAGVALSKMESAISAIWEEMKRMREVKLTEKELIAAKEKLRGPMLFSMENPASQMEWYARQALDRPDKLMSYDDVLNRLMLIDAEQIQQIAIDLFVPEKVSLALVGPIEESQKEKLLGIINK